MEISFHLFLLDLPAHPVDAALQTRLLQGLRKGLVVLAGGIDEQMFTLAAFGGENFRPQNGREEAGAVFPQWGLEESGDEVFIAEEQFALDEGFREFEFRSVPLENAVRQRTAIDDLHVVDGENRQVVQRSVQV